MISEIIDIEFFHPSAFYIIGGLLIPFLRGRVRQGYMLLVSFLAFFAVFVDFARLVVAFAVTSAFLL